MTTRELIFSNRRSDRISRHVLFWAVYTFYFYPQGIWYPDTLDQLLRSRVYVEALINFACFIPVCILATYVSIYVLLPGLFQKKRYKSFVFFFAMLFLLCIVLNFFASKFYFTLIPHPAKETGFKGTLYLSYVNSMAAIILSGISIGIKATKNWYKQQKENLEMSKKKARTELQLQKARIHPEFLFRTLSSINTRIEEGHDDASDMVLRLSDLLSYSLYCGKCKLVPLVQEIAALHDLIFLEKRRPGNMFNLSVSTTGDLLGSYIPPLTVLSLLNDTISFLNAQPDARGSAITIGIKLAKDHSVDIALRVHMIQNEGKAEWGGIIENCILRMEASHGHLEYELMEVIVPNEQGVNIRVHQPDNLLLNSKSKFSSYESV